MSNLPLDDYEPVTEQEAEAWWRDFEGLMKPDEQPTFSRGWAREIILRLLADLARKNVGIAERDEALDILNVRLDELEAEAEDAARIAELEAEVARLRTLRFKELPGHEARWNAREVMGEFQVRIEKLERVVEAAGAYRTGLKNLIYRIGDPQWDFTKRLDAALAALDREEDK